MCNQPNVSIIIPFYNVEEERFIQCIQSILNQTYSDFEIIVVNDGSKESYLNFLDSIKSLDLRITVYNEVNKGVSAARNFGIKKSRGNFVVFVDADDIVHANFLEQALSIAREEKIDYIIGATLSVDENEVEFAISDAKIHQGTNLYSIYMDEGIDILRLCLITSNQLIRFHGGGYIGRGPVARMIKRELALKCFFPENIVIGEDVIWNQLLLNTCKRLAVAENVWYYYIQNSFSAIHKYREDAIPIIRDQCILLGGILDLTKDDIYRAYCNRIFSETRLIICRGYITRNENRSSFLDKWRIFNSICNQVPWKYVTKRYFRMGDSKERFIYVLFKMRLYFLAAYIRDRVTS